MVRKMGLALALIAVVGVAYGQPVAGGLAVHPGVSRYGLLSDLYARK